VHGLAYPGSSSHSHEAQQNAVTPDVQSPPLDSCLPVQWTSMCVQGSGEGIIWVPQACLK
jgi:hypothetical protein